MNGRKKFKHLTYDMQADLIIKYVYLILVGSYFELCSNVVSTVHSWTILPMQ